MTMRAGHAETGEARNRSDDELDEVLRRAQNGRGSIVLREDDTEGAPPEGWIDRIRERPQVLLLTAAGRAPERAYPFAVVMQLFDDLGPGDAESPCFSDAGQSAAQLLRGELALDRVRQPAEEFTVVRSLMAVVQKLARRRDNPVRPIVVWVNALHYVDAPSLRFLAYLAARLEQLPIVLVLSGRALAAGPEAESIDAIRAVADIATGPVAAAPPGGEQQGTDRPAIPTPPPDIRSDAEREELTILASRAGLAGEGRTRVLELTERAWADLCDDGRLTSSPWLSSQLLRGLLAVDELELAAQILDDERHRAVERSTPVAAAAASESRAWMLFHQGRVAAAEQEARQGVAMNYPDDVRQSLQATLAACHVHCGRLPEAERLLSSLDGTSRHQARVLPILLETRAQLRLAQRRASDALRDTMEARRRSSTPDPPSFGPASWRCTAARALIALGRHDEATEYATQELRFATTREVTRQSIAALRVLAVASPAEEQLALLEQAVTIGDAVSSRLEHLYALVDLGAALRRGNQRRSARIILARVFGIAADLGAEGPAARAREELAAAGGRRPQTTATGVNALTPSERRVASLAASGHSTREIARDLFVTTKTVEFHLRHIYQKLGIPSSRAALADALRARAPEVDAPGASPGSAPPEAPRQ